LENSSDHSYDEEGDRDLLANINFSKYELQNEGINEEEEFNISKDQRDSFFIDIFLSEKVPAEDEN